MTGNLFHQARSARIAAEAMLLGFYGKEKAERLKQEVATAQQNADLDGRSVVDEAVIEAMAETIANCESIDKLLARRILKRHLTPTKPADGEGEKSEAESVQEHHAKVFLHSNGLSTERNAAEDVMLRLGMDPSDFRKRDPLVIAIGKHIDVERLALTAERDRLQARVAELEQQSVNRYRENATGDEWLFLPEDDNGERVGMRIKTKQSTVITAEEFAAEFAPLADEPIVDLRKFGAFPCWWKDGTVGDYIAWPSCGGMRYLGSDGDSSGWVDADTFDKHFTRTPPITLTLSPEQERMVGPLADWAKRKPEEAREFLAAQGAGA